MSDVSLPPGLSDAATEVIEDKINVLIILITTPGFR
jgi:hypothetical protein